MWQVPGSSRVKDALGDTIPPAPPVLHSLFPADAHFPKIFLDDIFPVLSRSTWSPPETLRFPYESLWRKSMVIHSWKMSKPSQTSASDNVFQLWKCSCLWLSHLLLCPSRKSPGYFVAICGVLLQVFHLCDWEWPQLCTVEQHGED